MKDIIDLIERVNKTSIANSKEHWKDIGFEIIHALEDTSDISKEQLEQLHSSAIKLIIVGLI